MNLPNHQPTPEENLLAIALKSRNIQLIQQYPHKLKVVDIYIPDVKLVIEVDGEQHLTSPHQILSDFHREYYDDLEGIHTLHVPNSFISDKTKLGEVVNAIANVRDLLLQESGKDYQLYEKYKEHYLTQLKKSAEWFFEAVEILEHGGVMKKDWSMFFFPGGFLASRCAECYIKALILKFEPNKIGFKLIRLARHDLEELHKIILKHEPGASCLDEDIRTINKYSGTKVIYPEYMMRAILNGTSEVYGNDYMESLNRIKLFVEERLK